MPRQYKQFHFTGLYGIILLIPALMFFYGFKTNTLVRTNAIFIDLEDNDPGYALYYFRHEQPFRTFVLTGNAVEERQALKDFRLAVQQMMATHDTVTGIKIQFNPKASYNAFIQAYSMMKDEHIEYYGIGDKSLWVINASEYDKKQLGNLE
jgi:hypothetical protein